LTQNDESSKDAVRAMYREMIGWAKEEGADLILAETMYFYEEAKIALEEINAAGPSQHRECGSFCHRRAARRCFPSAGSEAARC
jgi:methionine synthase I (cobalamin-dependent)